MARPIKRRRVCGMPPVREFAPSPETGADAVTLTVDEYEAIRLIDHLRFTQEGCADQMNVARTTVQAIYDTARRKLADALVNGKRLSIGGGSYDICPQSAGCRGISCPHRNGDASPVRCADCRCRCCGISTGDTEPKGVIDI